MLKKLLRAPLPEQIVALLEKLEQDPDASHLMRVDNLMDNSRAEFTWYEKRVIRYELNKVRNVIRRACTLDDVMSIVINEPTHDEKQKEKWLDYLSRSTGTISGRSTGTISGASPPYVLAQQAQIAHINAHQQLMTGVARYAQGYTDTRSLF